MAMGADDSKHKLYNLKDVKLTLTLQEKFA